MKLVFPWPQVGSITLTFPAQAGGVAVNKWLDPLAHSVHTWRVMIDHVLLLLWVVWVYWRRRVDKATSGRYDVAQLDTLPHNGHYRISAPSVEI